MRWLKCQKSCFPDDPLSWSILSSFLLPSRCQPSQVALSSCRVPLHGPFCPVSCRKAAVSPAKLPCPAAGCQEHSQMMHFLHFLLLQLPSLDMFGFFGCFWPHFIKIKKCPKLNMSILSPSLLPTLETTNSSVLPFLSFPYSWFNFIIRNGVFGSSCDYLTKLGSKWWDNDPKRMVNAAVRNFRACFTL